MLSRPTELLAEWAENYSRRRKKPHQITLLTRYRKQNADWQQFRPV